VLGPALKTIFLSFQKAALQRRTPQRGRDFMRPAQPSQASDTDALQEEAPGVLDKRRYNDAALLIPEPLVLLRQNYYGRGCGVSFGCFLFPPSGCPWP